MKIILIMGLLMLCALVSAQVIPRGVSQIVIANHDTALNMKLVSSVLTAGKYAIEFKDEGTGVITSGLIAVDNTAFKIRLNAYCITNKIIITGLVYTPDTQNGNEELIVNRGANDSPYLLGFNKMHSIAAKIEGRKSYK